MIIFKIGYCLFLIKNQFLKLNLFFRVKMSKLPPVYREFEPINNLVSLKMYLYVHKRSNLIPITPYANT